MIKKTVDHHVCRIFFRSEHSCAICYAFCEIPRIGDWAMTHMALFLSSSVMLAMGAILITLRIVEKFTA